MTNSTRLGRSQETFFDRGILHHVESCALFLDYPELIVNKEKFDLSPVSSNIAFIWNRNEENCDLEQLFRSDMLTCIIMQMTFSLLFALVSWGLFLNDAIMSSNMTADT